MLGTIMQNVVVWVRLHLEIVFSCISNQKLVIKVCGSSCKVPVILV